MSTRHDPRKTARQNSTAHHRKPYSLYRRNLRYEPLEDRRLLAVVTVTTLADTINFNDGVTSLREAIFATNTVPGADTINFASSLTASGPATILLTQGELKITDNLAITGPGATLLTIDASGSNPTPNQVNGDGARIFNIDDGTANVIDVSIAGLTLTGGQTLSNGGAILTMESLSITDSIINKNYCLTGSSSGGGVAAILRNGANVTISGSVVSNNQSYTRGGGIYLDVGANSSVEISETQVFNNGMLKSDTFDLGGGIYLVNSQGSATISDSKIHDNYSPGSGGGIFSSANVIIERSAITDNSAQVTGGGIQEGFNNAFIGAGALTLIDSTVVNNSAATGGGIRLGLTAATPHTITRSIIGANAANGQFFVGSNTPGGVGGGIYVEGGASQIVDSTFEENTARKSGGAIYQGGFSTAGFLIKGSTISNNSAESGGGVYESSGGTIYLSTVSENAASSKGGAVFANGGVLRVDNSILANNSSLAYVGDIARSTSATVSVFNSLIGDNNGSGLAEAPVGSPDANGNTIGGLTHGVIDPLLRPLADYGGPTITHALAPGSPAIDAGNPSLQAGVNDVPLYDQRGEPFGRIVGGRIDIGAFEFQGVPDSGLVVDTLVDESDGNYAPGDLSLREAIQLANLGPDANTIHFDPALTAYGRATILLTLGDLRIVGDVAIDGPGANLLTIDASGNDPTPDVNDGAGSGIFGISDAREELLDVSLSGLTLTGGDTQYGGAVLSTENLTITNSTISGNYASRLGGGVVGIYGNLEISNCIISDNETGDNGGGVAASDAEVLITNSTISGNVAHVGGGIHAYASELSIVDSDVTDNSAVGFDSVGGGIFDKVGPLAVTGSTISGNVADIGGGIYSADEAHVVSSSITGNVANIHGGGIYSFGSVEIRTTTVSDNSAALDGGGVRARADVMIDSSTLSGNVAGRSGGGAWIDLPDLTATIINTTISTNSADTDGGGIWIDNLTDGSVMIRHSTITQNTAGFGDEGSVSGGGIFVSRGTINLDHTIVAGNHDNTGAAPDVAGIINANRSLIGVGANFLGPLADNGGPTKTHALLAGSPAINAGDPAAMASVNGVPLYDQRGVPFTRVYGGRIDIGAFEFQPTDHVLGDFNRDGVVDAADYTLWRKQLDLSVTPGTGADANGDGLVNDADFVVWRSNFGQTQAQSAATLAQAPGAKALENASTIPSEQPTALSRKSSGDQSGSLNDSPRFTSPLSANEVSPRSDKRAMRSARKLSMTTDTTKRLDDAIDAWLASVAGTDKRRLLEYQWQFSRDEGAHNTPASLVAALAEAFTIMGAGNDGLTGRFSVR